MNGATESSGQLRDHGPSIPDIDAQIRGPRSQRDATERDIAREVELRLVKRLVRSRGGFLMQRADEHTEVCR